MKRSLLAIAIALSWGLSVPAQAVVWSPPGGVPLYAKFTNAEQLATVGNGITAPASGYNLPSGISTTEQNWGVLALTDLFLGDNTTPNDPYLYPAITGFGADLLPSTVQVTGIFYGIQAYGGGACPTVICSVGGYLDLWIDAASLANTAANLATATPSQRAGQNLFTNFTDGEFLARLGFDWGIVTGNEEITIKGNVAASDLLGQLQGQAESYANVLDVNNDGVIDSGDGAWAALLNGNYFPVVGASSNVEFRDFRFNNNYNRRTNWDAPNATDCEAEGAPPTIPEGCTAVGAVSDDPARVVSVPEPGTIGLLGLGLLGLGFSLRRRKT